MSAENPSPIRDIAQPRLILCEGEGDQSFFRHLIEQRELPPYQIEYPRGSLGGGRSSYARTLTALSAVRGFRDLTGILVVADNDDDPEASFQETARLIGAAEGFASPRRPLEVVFSPSAPPVVVFMLPRTGIPGNLESLCLESAYASHPETGRCLDAYVECTGVTAWRPSRQLKMRMRAFIAAACQHDPNTSLVHAWSDGREGLVPLDHPSFHPLADFLRDFDNQVAPRMPQT